MSTEQKKPSGLAALMSSKAAVGTTSAAAALAKLQSTTPEQHADKIKGIEAEATVMAAFIGTDGPVPSASVPGEFSALFGRGLLKMDGENLFLTDLGKSVRTVLHGAPAATTPH